MRRVCVLSRLCWPWTPRSCKQADVTKTFKTSKDSIRKYRELLVKLTPTISAGDEASHGIIDVRQPGVAAACSSRPLLSQDWIASHLPSVRRVARGRRQAPVTDEHERACRRLEVVVPRPSRPLPTTTRRRLHCRHACCQHANRSRWLHDLRAWFAAGTSRR